MDNFVAEKRHSVLIEKLSNVIGDSAAQEYKDMPEEWLKSMYYDELTFGTQTALSKGLIEFFISRLEQEPANARLLTASWTSNSVKRTDGVHARLEAVDKNYFFSWNFITNQYPGFENSAVTELHRYLESNYPYQVSTVVEKAFSNLLYVIYLHDKHDYTKFTDKDFNVIVEPWNKTFPDYPIFADYLYAKEPSV
jgi:hypothetical protein